VERVRAAIPEGGAVLAILDADHSRDHVLDELRAYAAMVTPGSYCIVEDTNLNGNPVLSDFGPGPMEAVEAFLAERDDFTPDRSLEELMLTAAPKGFLYRAR
jgi:cephalosporin hydroxylase